jgi:tRNA pseudouridine38-40 synthase
MSDAEQAAISATTYGPRTWKLTLAYDGTDFHGWQVQPDKPTIQGELQAALGHITGESPLPQGSGRTDAGVHALAQVASFSLNAPIPSENLLRALNRTLPASIRVIDARTALSAAFHARHSALAKTYEYRIFRGEICSPFLSRFVFPCPWPMDFGVLETAARVFVGEHDFQSFAASDPDLARRTSAIEPETGPSHLAVSTVRTIFSSCWEQRAIEEGALWVYRVRGNGFLHHMVRNLVGTMLDACRGHLTVDEIPKIVAARSRPSAGPTAPARGLFLHSVEYPSEDSQVARAGSMCDRPHHSSLLT